MPKQEVKPESKKVLEPVETPVLASNEVASLKMPESPIENSLTSEQIY